MARIRRRFSAEFKCKVALAAIRGDATVAQLAGQYQVHAHQVTAWRKQALATLPQVFGQAPQQEQARRQELVEELYGQIGRLKMEVEFLKKSRALSLAAKRAAIEPTQDLSMSHQCKLLSLPRSSLYYRPAHAAGAAPGGGGESARNLALMRLLDRQFIETPFYGVRRMTAWLLRLGHDVNVKRVRRLMRVMGLETIYPRPRKMLASTADSSHRKFPYLLKGMTINRPDQVWAADITYVPLYSGWAYADPALVVQDVIDAIGNGLAQFLVQKIMHAHLFGLALRPPFAAGILEIPN